MKFNKNKFFTTWGATSTVAFIVLCFSIVVFLNRNKVTEAIAQSCVPLPTFGDPKQGALRGAVKFHGCRTDTREDTSCSVFKTGTYRCNNHEYACGIHIGHPDCDKTKGNCTNVRPICCPSQ